MRGVGTVAQLARAIRNPAFREVVWRELDGHGTLRPVVGQEIPLAEASRAHRALLEPGAHGKIVLIP